MPDQLVSPARPPARVGRWVAVSGVVVTLLLIGVYDDFIHTLLIQLWQRILAAVGLRQQAEAMQQGISGGITKRFLPAVATYAGLYLGLCLLLLRLLLSSAQWRLVLRLYAGVLAVYVAIVLLGKFSGDAGWAYRLSRQILDFVVSPLPVAGLLVLFQSGFGPQVRRP